MPKDTDFYIYGNGKQHTISARTYPSCFGTTVTSRTFSISFSLTARPLYISRITTSLFKQNLIFISLRVIGFDAPMLNVKSTLLFQRLICCGETAGRVTDPYILWSTVIKWKAFISRLGSQEDQHPFIKYSNFRTVHFDDFSSICFAANSSISFIFISSAPNFRGLYKLFSRA